MMNIRLIFSLLTFWVMSCFLGIAQQKQIPRIEAMPDKPSPYQTFDWKALAKAYDSFVFDVNSTGTHLPLTTISAEDGINYPVKNIRMATYVGQDSKQTAEAINIMPSIIGASLVGIDKSNQNNINWVEKVKDFFNQKNGQDVYLNNYSAVTGNDWWYELMPNVYFYQLYTLYPNGAQEFNGQFNIIADRQLDVVYKLGGTQSPWQYPNMNYRAFNLETGKGVDNGVKEPESAGTIAWILHQAYLKTQDKKYLTGAELALDFLQNHNENPSYEIQLPYGIQTAAKLNATENAEYDIDKFLKWTFSDGKNTLRGWGTIVGKWNGYDMFGLIGEANDAGNDYAFLMNGFQHAAALAPVAKYDKRYAKAIGKWLLNLSNASRFFYPNQLPEANQESVSLAWSKQNDPKSSIPYESIKESLNGVNPYATGDALAGGWAPTNLSLYSGASVGYLASILNNTNVEGVLQIDLNKTDFGSENQLDTYLCYNPNTQDETVTIQLPSGNYNIYDAITETTLSSNVNGNVNLVVPAGDIRQIVLYPANATPVQDGKILKLSNGKVLDYHYKWNYTPTLRIKSLYAPKEELISGNETEITVLAENGTTPTYEWFVNNEKQTNGTSALNWIAPDKEGEYFIKIVVKANNQIATDSVKIQVLSASSISPEIKEIKVSGRNPYNFGDKLEITAEANVSDGITWKYSGGTLTNEDSLTPAWELPSSEGVYTLELIVKNSKGEASKSIEVLVKDLKAKADFTPVIYYPMDGDVKNAAQDGLNGVLEGAVLTTDPQREPDRAYKFENNAQFIYTSNDSQINFQDQLTLSFWVRPSALGEGEQFVLSHGSWEERFKASLTPEKKMRFTINTTDRIVDMDDPTVLENDAYAHYTFVFTGYSLEIYRNGELATFTPLSGKINKSTKALTIARKDQTTNEYTYKGAIDEVRLYDKALDIENIKQLPSLFQSVASNSVEIKNLSIDGQKWDINNRYLVDCANSKDELIVEIETFSGSKVDKNNIKVDVRKAAVQKVLFNISTEDGSKNQDYVLTIEVPFKWSDIITQKWNKVLTVNNNSSTNGGFDFSSYKWFRNGALVGTKQYYSVGNNSDEVLDPTALYHVEMVTKDNEDMRVCPFYTEPQSVTSVNVYPNPVNLGERICIDAQVSPEILETAKVDVYTLSGLFVRTINLKEEKTYFNLSSKGLHVLKYEAKDGYQKSFKILVK